MEVLTALLTKALQQQTLEQQRSYVQQALDIAAGLDPYLDEISSPPSQVFCLWYWAVRATLATQAMVLCRAMMLCAFQQQT
jgi:hypothetical protein